MERGMKMNTEADYPTDALKGRSEGSDIRQKEIRMVLGNLQHQIEVLQKAVWEFVERVDPILSNNIPAPGDPEVAGLQMETELGGILDDFAIKVAQIKDKVERAMVRVEL